MHGFSGNLFRFNVQVQGLLGGSWFGISGVISMVTIVITHVRGLIAPLITTHEPVGFMVCRQMAHKRKYLATEQFRVHGSTTIRRWSPTMEGFFFSLPRLRRPSHPNPLI